MSQLTLALPAQPLVPTQPKRVSAFEAAKTKTAQVELVRKQLVANDEWLKRGILAIYSKQTEHEQSQEATLEHNNVGFSGTDGTFMSSIAKQLQQGRSLSPKQLSICRKIMPKYARQLTEIARAR